MIQISDILVVLNTVVNPVIEIKRNSDYGEINLIDFEEAKLQIKRADEFLNFTKTQLNH